MVTIDKIDFTKLKPYDGKTTKCFEQLCYQIAQREYGHLGTFTTIDGAGGDGGVEFYLNLDNGDKWGWQCKYFGDTGRLNTGNRKTQITNSLETACRNHTDLSKWILCIKTDLTENSTTKNGTVTKGERDWFDNTLPNSIPHGCKTRLEHWGESKFIEFLNSTKHIGIRGFFFGELEFSQEWFRTKFDENIEKVKDKYDPELHTIDIYTQSIIDFTLFDPNYCKLLESLKEELLEQSRTIEKAIKEFTDEKMIDPKEELQRKNYALYCKEFRNHVAYTIEKIEFIERCFKNYSEEELSNFSIKDVHENFFEYFSKIDYSVFEEKSSAFRDASEISYLISEFGNIYNKFFRRYYHQKQKEIHFLADAAKGKTHLSCDLAFRKIDRKKPSIFITGDKFTDETNLSESLRRILDVNLEFTLDDFIKALDVYGSIIKCKIPIIIDGLNETTHNRLFSPLWKNHLSSLTTKISQTSNIVIITTCRKSYAERVWEDLSDNRFHYLNGFEDYKTVVEAVKKYFDRYKLKGDLFYAPLEKFRDPIFLKIFCEIKNPKWQSGNEVEVNVEEESTYQVFNEYLNQVNKRVTTSNHLLKAGDRFIHESIAKLSNYLWDENLREIPVVDFYSLIDGSKDYEKDRSRADILINEGLVVTRDMRHESEYVSFTYDILAGYTISESLVRANSDLKHFTSNKFINKIIQKGKQHPLYEDIISALCLLLPQLKGVYIHELIQQDRILKFTKSKLYQYLPQFASKQFTKRISFSDYTFSQSIASLFKLPAEYVKDEVKDLVATLFLSSGKNKKVIFDLTFKMLSDTKHPLNAIFLSNVLESMPMNQRDISWTEYIRGKSYDIEVLIEEFESQCKNQQKESAIIIQKQHLLSKIIVWLLTSTDRKLRDEATRALYYYGRKFPDEYSSLVYESLKYNDPYVWERTLSALYGVVMAEHNSFKSEVFKNTLLPDIGKSVYRLLFAEEAPYSTTHILARDYARRIVEICVQHHPELLSIDELKNLRPPYTFGGIRDLGEYDYGEKDYDYAGPIRMDFSNYTIGHLVKDGSAYANPTEKVKVRRQIYWRIYDLGWSETIFQNAEKAIGNADYYSARTERAKVERYGKKYSWIAYFENAGLRDDLGLLDNEWGNFRISDTDIDPSFPVKVTREQFIKEDLLGDRAISLEEWYRNGGMPDIERYLSIKENAADNRDWICVDAFLSQEDLDAERRGFSFVRALIIKEDDYVEAIELLKNQDIGGRWLPEKHDNYYTFAGELYCFANSTADNWTEIEFVTGTKKIKVRKGEPGYLERVLRFSFDQDDSTSDELPEEVEMDFYEKKTFEVLMPVMGFSWETYHSHVNDAGYTNVLSKEVANYLELVSSPQTFELFEPNGSKASINKYYYLDYNNNHSFVYLRKDLLDKFLSENKLRFVWAIWGERDVAFRTDKGRHEFFGSHSFNKPQGFQKIVEYDDSLV